MKSQRGAVKGEPLNIPDVRALDTTELIHALRLDISDERLVEIWQGISSPASLFDIK